MKGSLPLILVVSLFTVLLAACGSSGTPTPTPGETRVDVELGEWFVQRPFDAIPSGAVRFEAHNGGQLEHELVILRTGLQPDALPMRSGDPSRADEDAAGELVGEIEPDELGPGQRASLALNLDPGNYVLLCNLPGHYQLGMYAPLIVGATLAP